MGLQPFAYHVDVPKTWLTARLPLILQASCISIDCLKIPVVQREPSVVVIGSYGKQYPTVFDSHTGIRQLVLVIRGEWFHI